MKATVLFVVVKCSEIREIVFFFDIKCFKNSLREPEKSSSPVRVIKRISYYYQFLKERSIIRKFYRTHQRVFPKKYLRYLLKRNLRCRKTENSEHPQGAKLKSCRSGRFSKYEAYS